LQARPSWLNLLGEPKLDQFMGNIGAGSRGLSRGVSISFRSGSIGARIRGLMGGAGPLGEYRQRSSLVQIVSISGASDTAQRGASLPRFFRGSPERLIPRGPANLPGSGSVSGLFEVLISCSNFANHQMNLSLPKIFREGHPSFSRFRPTSGALHGERCLSKAAKRRLHRESS
jgi:hypothetical protein